MDSWWVITAADGYTLQLNFHLLDLREGESLKVMLNIPHTKFAKNKHVA